MIDALRRTLVAVKDLGEQPASRYVLVAGAGGTRYYAVDWWEVVDGTVNFYQGATGSDSKLIFACKVEGSWSIVNREVAELLTEEEVLRSAQDDHKALDALHKELHPEEAGAVARDPGHYL